MLQYLLYLLDDGEVEVADDALSVGAHQDVLRLQVAVRDPRLALILNIKY